MIVYYLSFATAAILSVLYPKVTLRSSCSLDQKRTRCIFISFLPIAAVFLFRWGIGVDSNWAIGSYPVYYHALANQEHIFISEPLFEFIASSCARVGISYFFWLFILGVFYLYSVGKFIKYNSSDYAMSILLFFFSDLFFFAVGALRQALAISFILLLYCDDPHSKMWKKVIYMLLAVLSHSSAVLGVVGYLFGNIKLYRRSALCGTVIIFFSAPLTTLLLKSMIGFTSYGARYNGTSLATDQFAVTYVMVSGCILLCTLFEYDHIYNERTAKLINLLILFFFFMINSGALIQTFRIIYYFMPAIIIIIPEIYKKASSNLSKFVLGGMATMSIILLFYNTYYRHDGKALYENYQTIFSCIRMISAV